MDEGEARLTKNASSWNSQKANARRVGLTDLEFVPASSAILADQRSLANTSVPRRPSKQGNDVASLATQTYRSLLLSGCRPESADIFQRFLDRRLELVVGGGGAQQPFSSLGGAGAGRSTRRDGIGLSRRAAGRRSSFDRPGPPAASPRSSLDLALDSTRTASFFPPRSGRKDGANNFPPASSTPPTGTFPLSAGINIASSTSSDMNEKSRKFFSTFAPTEGATSSTSFTPGPMPGHLYTAYNHPDVLEPTATECLQQQYSMLVGDDLSQARKQEINHLAQNLFFSFGRDFGARAEPPKKPPPKAPLPIPEMLGIQKIQILDPVLKELLVQEFGGVIVSSGSGTE